VPWLKGFGNCFFYLLESHIQSAFGLCKLSEVVSSLYYPLVWYFILQTLYTFPENFRAYKALIAAQYSGAKIKVASEPPQFTFGETNKTDEYLKKFPLGRVRRSLLIRVCENIVLWIRIVPYVTVD